MSQILSGPAAAILASLSWALGVMAYSKLSERHPAYIINLHRLLLSAPFFGFVYFTQVSWSDFQLALGQERLVWTAIAVLSSYAFGDVLFLLAAQRLGVPSALAIASAYPVWAALAASFVNDEQLAELQIVGVVVVVAATIFVILSAPAPSGNAIKAIKKFPVEGNEAKHGQREMLINGVALALGCSFCWAMNSYAIAKVGNGFSTVGQNFLRLSMGLVLCPLVGILMQGPRSLKLIPWSELKPYLPLFLFEALAGPYFYVYGLTHSPLAIGAALTALAPVISVPLAILLKRERFSIVRSVGVLSVVLGIWLLLAGKA